MANLAKLADWLWVAFTSLSILIHNAFVRLFNHAIEGVANLAEQAVSMMPTYTCPTPGQFVDSVGFLHALNWVLPISFFVDVLTMFVFGVLAFNALAPIFRWTKLFR